MSTLRRHYERQSKRGRIGGFRSAKSRQLKSLKEGFTEDDIYHHVNSDRKGSYYGTFTRFDGVRQDMFYSLNRKDQLDIYDNNEFKTSAGSRETGKIIFELV